MEYLYKLVVFLDDKSSISNIDIVPSSWVSWDEMRNSLVSKFMSPPYTAAKKIKLQNLIEAGEPPIKTWSIFRVETRGRASNATYNLMKYFLHANIKIIIIITGTYSEAEARLEILKEQEYAFTEESEVDGRSQSVMDTETYKIKSKETSSLRKELDSAFQNLNKNKEKCKRKLYHKITCKFICYAFIA